MASKIVVNLDTSKEVFLNSKCKQNDDLSLECNIFENGLAKDLTNCSIVIQALKADKTYIIQNTDITKNKNKFIANLVRDFTRVAGETEIEIVLTESSKQNTTFSFCLEVVGSVIRGAVESKNTVTMLENLQDKIEEAGVVKQETEQLIEKGGAATKGDIQEVNAQLETKASKDDVARISNGTPLFASDITEMIDTTKNYVNMLDGYIYSYSNGSWLKTTIKYQATGIGNGSIDFATLSDSFNVLGKYEVVYGTKVSGYYKNTDGSFISNVGYTGATLDCKPYEKYKITGAVTGAVTSLVNFYDINNNLLSHLMPGNGTSLTTYNDFEITIPQNCVKIAVNYYSNMYTPIFKKLIVSDFNLNDNKVTAEKVNFIEKTKNKFDIKSTEIKNGYYYSSAGILTSNPNYKSFKFAVEAKKTYTLTSYHHFLVFLDSQGNSLGTKGTSGTLIENATITIPDGCTSIGISQLIAYDMSNYMIVEGSILPSNFEPYELKLNKNIKVDASSIHGDKKLSGKKLILFGDSITANQDRYVNVMLNLTGLNLINNFAVSGARWRNYSDTVLDGNPINGTHSNTMCNQVQKLINNKENYEVPDIIIMSAGTNDDYYDTTVIESQFTNNKEYIDVSQCDLTTFAGAMRWCCEKIYSLFPNVKIFIATQIQGAEKTRVFAWQQTKVKIVKEVANRLAVPIIDAFTESKIYGRYEIDGANGKYLIDGLHPNLEGGKVLGEYYTNELKIKYNSQ